jgi:S-adenosylmethionine:tRNA ribosyltransferase-isomerase
MGNTDNPEKDSPPGGPQGLSAQNFDYFLDERRIAQEPLARRDLSRLMVLNRSSGAICHQAFGDLPRLLRRGDLLVLNDTSVIPAKFFARRASGGRIEGLFLRQDSPGNWLALLKNAQKCRIAEKLQLEGSPDVRLELVENLGQGQYRLAVHPPLQAEAVLEQAGMTPLPPYIHRAGATPQAQADRSRYQTVYASVPGAIAAPTAGLHFTPSLLGDLAAQGIETTRLTLHVGMGTFLPVKCDDLKTHKMHSEWYDLSAGAAEAINRARREGRRIVAVGTTSVRVLETVARQTTARRPSPLSARWPSPLSARWPSLAAASEGGGQGWPPPITEGTPATAPTDLVTACHGWTDIFLYPPLPVPRRRCPYHQLPPAKEYAPHAGGRLLLAGQNRRCEHDPPSLPGSHPPGVPLLFLRRRDADRVSRTLHQNLLEPAGKPPGRVGKPPERVWKPPEPVGKPLEPTRQATSS